MLELNQMVQRSQSQHALRNST